MNHFPTGGCYLQFTLQTPNETEQVPSSYQFTGDITHLRC